MDNLSISENQFWIRNGFKTFVPVHLAYALCSCYLVLWKVFNIPLVIPVLILLAEKIISFPYFFGVLRNHRSEVFYFYGSVLEMIFYLLLIPASFGKIGLIYAGIPLYIWNFFSALLDYKNSSTFSLLSYFVITLLSWCRSLFIICFDLRLLEVIEWNWIFIFWPFWLTSFLSGLIAVWNFIDFLFKRCKHPQKIGLFWFQVTLTCYPLMIIILILGLSEYKSGNGSYFIPAFLSFFIFSLVYLGLTVLFRTEIESYFIYMFTNFSEEKTGHSIKRVFKTFKIAMKLSKINSTLYSTKTTANHAKSDSQNSLKDCLICCSSPCDSIFMPCGHAGVCNACALKLLETTKICHICRKGIEKVLQLVNDKNKVVLVTEVDNE